MPTCGHVWRPFVLSLTLALAPACGGDDDDDGLGGGSDLEAACAKLVACGLNGDQSAATCVSETQQEVEDGEATEEELAACTSCVNDHACDEIVSACGDLCT